MNKSTCSIDSIQDACTGVFVIYVRNWKSQKYTKYMILYFYDTTASNFLFIYRKIYVK